MRFTTTGCAFCAAGLVLSATAPMVQAETTVGLAAISVPDYIGSDVRIVAPVPSFSFDLGKVSIKSNGLGVEANVAGLLGSTGPLSYGPILRYDTGRNDGSKVDDPVVALTKAVKAAPEVGGFVELALPLGESGLLGQARVSVVKGLGNGHQGTLVESSLGLGGRSGSWSYGGQITAAWGSDSYQNAYFGVSAADSAATGLAAYTADGGLRDTGISTFVSYAVNDRFSVDLVAGFSRLASDAADSPLVAQRGKREQTFVGLGVSYAF
jgi:MipA family protein